MLDQASKKQIVDRVHECVAIVEKKYKVVFKKPLVTFNVRGTDGGHAVYSEWKVDFNPILAKDNLQTYLDDVVPHEVAHLATKLIYPEALRRQFGKKRRPHGAEWASIMVALGADPKRTHEMDTEKARVKRNVTRYSYQCVGCGKTLELTAKKHKALQCGALIWHKGCGSVNGRLRYVVGGATPKAVVSPTPVIKPAVAPTAPKAPAAGSKLAQCDRLFENYPGYTRAEMINVFVQECNCTPAGAATYYAALKKKYGR